MITMSHDEGPDQFVTICLDLLSCSICQLDTGEDVVICKICQSNMINEPIKFGFNNVSRFPHANIMGHAKCFENFHNDSENRSISCNHTKIHNLQRCTNDFNSSLNSIASSQYRKDPQSLGICCEIQLTELELKRHYYKYLFGEHSKEFANVTKRLEPPEETDSEKEIEEEERLADSNILSYLNGSCTPGKDSKISHSKQSHQRKKSPYKRMKTKPFNLVNGLKSLRKPKVPESDVNVQDINGEDDDVMSGGDWMEKRFIDLQQENVNVDHHRVRIGSCHENYTKKELGTLNYSLLKELVNSLQRTVTETSSTLVELLEERDNLRHKNRSLHVTIQKLVRLQSDPRCDVQIRMPASKEPIRLK